MVFVGLLLFSGNAFSKDYYEDFDDGSLDLPWSTSDTYAISNGVLHVTGGGISYNDYEVSSVGLNLNGGEFINHFEADVMIPNVDDSQIIGIALQWYEDDWTGYQVHLQFNPWSQQFQASLAAISMSMPDFTHSAQLLGQENLSVGNLGEWYSLSITLESSFIKVSINGEETDLFDGIYQPPNSTLKQSTGYVHGSIPYAAEGDLLNYFADNLKAISIPGTGPGLEPVANAGPDTIVYNQVSFDGSQSYDPDGSILIYNWDLKYRDDSTYNIIANGANPIISNLQSGFYDVTLTVTDDDGLTGTDSMVLAVAKKVVNEICPGNSENNGPKDKQKKKK